MRERRTADWAAARRRRWSASRIAAAVALHALVLVSMKLAIDRVEMPRRGADRVTTLVTVALHAAPPPPLHVLPLPRANAPAARVARAPAPPRVPDEPVHTITQPSPPPEPPAVTAATPPASSPRPDLSFLDNAATRRAIRNVARGDTLASHGNAATHEDNGSELLARNIAAAHKGDCGKGEYLGGGMGLLSAPFLLAAEAMGKCSSN